MTITRFRKGELSVPILYVNTIDTISGNLKLYAESGVLSYISNLGNLVVGGDITPQGNDLRDSGFNVILSGDGSGNIDNIGRIDSAVTFPTNGMILGVTPATNMLSSHTKQDDGSVRATANGTIVISLTATVVEKILNQSLDVDKISVFYETSASGAYIDESRVIQNPYTGASPTTVKTDSTDKGNGSTGHSSFDLSGLTIDLIYQTMTIEFDVVVPSGYVAIDWIEMYLKPS